MNNKITTITNVEWLRRVLLIKAFTAHRDNMLMLAHTVTTAQQPILRDMIANGLIQPVGINYTITQRGIAAWYAVVRSWWSVSANSRVARQVLDHYNPDGSPIAQEAAS